MQRTPEQHLSAAVQRGSRVTLLQGTALGRVLGAGGSPANGLSCSTALLSLKSNSFE